MFQGLVQKFSRRRRFLKSLQIELSSSCTLKCTMCPRTTFNQEWNNGLMPPSILHAASNIFRHSQNVHLQGWGEPLLNPSIFHAVNLAKEQGCSVSFTTNGVSLTDEFIEKLIRLNLDNIVVSLAGATADTHEKI